LLQEFQKWTPCKWPKLDQSGHPDSVSVAWVCGCMGASESFWPSSLPGWPDELVKKNRPKGKKSPKR
jgi:hypothetical protein